MVVYRGYGRPEDEPREETVANFGDEQGAAGQGADGRVSERLSKLDQASRLALLTHCLNFGVNALRERVNPSGAGISASGIARRMKNADMLAKAVDLDMV